MKKKDAKAENTSKVKKVSVGKPKTTPKAEKVETAKSKSAISIMQELLKKKASDKEIENVFTEIYFARGQKDAEFISKRISIYKKIAVKEASNEKK